MNGINLYNVDCMEFMKGVKDKAYDLAIVDPPYGIGADKMKRRQKLNRPNSYTEPIKHLSKDWDKRPGHEYFTQLFRVSENQVIWGGNFLASLIGKDSQCWLVWDKNIGGDQADCELAWTSFDSAIRKFFGHPFIGTMGGLLRIHPTQKPVALYKWIIKNYAKEGDRILDTHGGSMSIAIACYDLGFELDLCELDKDYYKAGVERFDAHVAKYAPASEIPVTKKGEIKLF